MKNLLIGVLCGISLALLMGAGQPPHSHYRFDIIDGVAAEAQTCYTGGHYHDSLVLECAEWNND